ncbi:hypothetical protein KSF78_0000161 [Schistosoma japonicum]|nr:hypothetical protein KSF78_0000161 [Schistosoma japonicum]KAH8849415.1 hypothetical protein KSF78_0000161 [Schistosoma japonicum]
MGIYNSSHPDITFMGACCAKSCFYCIRTYCFLVVCKEQSQHLVYFLSGVVSDSVMQPAAATVGEAVFWVVKLTNKILTFFLDSKCSPGSFAELVSICLENGSIMSTTDLSRWISSGLYGALNIANKLAPCHRNHPLSFFIISSTISIGCILLSLYVSGLTLAYLALNICLILPTLIHHNVISRVWNLIKPILTRVEAEFDKNPLESPEERDAGERELYEPIVAAAHAANSSIFPAGFLTDENIKPESNQIESEDLDNSEAMFIRQFVSDISSEELDRLFSEALGEHETVVPPQKSRYDNKSHSNNNSNFIDAEYPHILNQEVDSLHSQPRLWAMESEYATDDDESSDIMGEVYPASVTTNKDVEHEGFVFVRKQE